ncbi:L-histidine N(alpha)-methyltransferase [Nodularia harveyana UHCC-0300]|uniref:L-histidine N(Alpha)-methyltransferase n=1 Tax=Nodularia harveyana UHCC-0300 TaxID=2974287 RepID=A0ABU5UB70_9CYAN|nr:L-histidine N(alpha)-methyltransferase [Nodularia harveyana]MEA5580769.1 L-histidine N(alpha)-methyltransferase [Nodularia harveyana UHCC-0300]
MPKETLEFLSSPKELLELIEALENSREIPVKYAYRGRGATVWDNFYQKYVVPKWYQPNNVEIELLQNNFNYLNGSYQNCPSLNIIDVGAGNSYPVKKYISQLDKLGKINQYLALDISEELLKVSQANIQKWFPKIAYSSYTVDIETSAIPGEMWKKNPAEDVANIFLHLGVTIGNHRHRNRVWQNFRNSMNKNDLLVITNEIGNNSAWDGQARGGCKYHVEGIYHTLQNKLQIRAGDSQLLRRYDTKTDSVIATMKFLQNYTFRFNQLGVDQTVEIVTGEEVTIWRHHKHQMSELRQELETADLKLVHYSLNKYSTHIMAICQVVDS